ncbi:MAG TPA: FAD-dependent oxidoreductase [Pyrinomonadaceae bacterium]|nr:FAD-dependent oxidoreductase [Pyrinomonadaceae bacterium]
MDRSKILARVRERTQPWDIVIIGGGATGVGCALDAASRGLDVLLLEQSDFGKGTSSRSTKLVHGGVRYLRQGNISLVREALRERGILLKNAPHVVHIQEFIVPCYSLLQKLFYGVGLKIYDMLAGKSSLGRSRKLSREDALQMLPNVSKDRLSGVVLYTDGQFDDTRLLIDMAVTASEHGAALVNYAAVRSLTKDVDDNVNGAEFEDVLSGEKFVVNAKSVINATGAYCDPIRKMSDPSAQPVITFARGSHIVLDARFLPGNAAIMIPKTSDGRVLFCIPWLGHLLLGTTDVPCETAALGDVVSEDEVDFLLETAGAYLSEQPTREDILSRFAGVRPLISRGGTANTAKLARSHELFVDGAGLVTITGGKWTTYRRMAEEAVDAVIKVGGLKAGKCITETLPIKGPIRTAGERIHPDLPYTREDVVRAVRDEMAMCHEDVLARRIRAQFLNERAASELVPMVEEIMAEIRSKT